MTNLVFSLAQMILNTVISVSVGVVLGIFLMKALDGELPNAFMFFAKVLLILMVSIIWLVSVSSDVYLILIGKITSPQTSTWVHLFFGIPVGIINKDYLANKIDQSKFIPEALKSSTKNK